jgi:kynurenine formamidase
VIGKLGDYRVVDLTKKIVPGKMGRRCEVRLNHSERTDDYNCDIDIMSHLGTHIEAPYHWDLDWKDVSDLPATAYMGRCVMLRITDIEPAGKITAAHMDQADGGRVREGDIVLVDTPHHLPPFTYPEKEIRPYVNAEMGQWLVDKGVKCVGFADGVDIETNVPEFQEFHRVAMAHDITFIEVLENFDELEQDVFFLSALPLPFQGLDSCPVRVVAIEGMPGFDE